jgi:hypothetical protein
MLWEQLREVRRLDDVKQRPSDFADLLMGSENAADDLQQQLSGARAASVKAAGGPDTALTRVVQTCAACHKKHRN